MPSRRALLTAGVATLSTASAGCTGLLESSPPDPLLQDITIRSMDDESHVMEFALDRNGQRILDTTYELGPRNSEDGGPDHVVSIDGAWESPRGSFTADVRIRGGSRAEFELDDPVDPATPYRYEIRVTEDGGLAGWFSELETTMADP